MNVKWKVKVLVNADDVDVVVGVDAGVDEWIGTGVDDGDVESEEVGVNMEVVGVGRVDVVGVETGREAEEMWRGEMDGVGDGDGDFFSLTLFGIRPRG